MIRLYQRSPNRIKSLLDTTSARLSPFKSCLYAISFLVLLLITTTSVDAQVRRPGFGPRRPKVNFSAIPLDRIQLKSGANYLGIITKKDDTNYEILVERSWFKKKSLKKYTETLQQEQKSIQSVQKFYQERIRNWRKELDSSGDWLDLISFLEREEKKLPALSTGKKPIFCKVEIPIDKVKRISTSTAAEKKIAGIAWKHQIDFVSEKTAGKIRSLLRKKGVDYQSSTFDLSDEVLPSVPSEESWMAKQAILRFKYGQQDLYNKVGSKFIERGQKLDLSQMLSLFGGGGLSLENTLSDLARDLPEFRHLADQRKKRLEAKDWWNGIQTKMEAKWKSSDGLTQPTAVLVKRQVQDGNLSRAKIQSVLVVRLPNGTWKVASRQESTATANDISDDQLEALKTDPTIKKALQFGKSFGGVGGSKIQQALKFGAMVQTAIQKNSEAFDSFTDQHTKSLFGPTLRIE